MVKVRPSLSCAPFSKRPESASTSIPRRIWCVFNERIRLGAEGGGSLVGDDALFAVLTACEKANEGQSITFFEVTTAAAFMLFSEHPADYLLLEVGLGGRFDATNVIDASAGHGDHAGVDRSSGIPWRDGR